MTHQLSQSSLQNTKCINSTVATKTDTCNLMHPTVYSKLQPDQYPTHYIDNGSTETTTFEKYCRPLDKTNHMLDIFTSFDVIDNDNVRKITRAFGLKYTYAGLCKGLANIYQ